MTPTSHISTLIYHQSEVVFRLSRSRLSSSWAGKSQAPTTVILLLLWHPRMAIFMAMAHGACFFPLAGRRQEVFLNWLLSAGCSLLAAVAARRPLSYSCVRWREPHADARFYG